MAYVTNFSPPKTYRVEFSQRGWTSERGAYADDAGTDTIKTKHGFNHAVYMASVNRLRPDAPPANYARVTAENGDWIEYMESMGGTWRVADHGTATAAA